MSERKKGKPDRFVIMAKAIARYLEDKGWRVIVVGDTRIQQPFGERQFNYEFVTRITAHKPEPKPRGTSQAG
jgi:hypothetical protein